MTRNSKALREKAKALIAEAERIEQGEAIEIGKYVRKAGYTLATIKALVEKKEAAE